MWQTDCSCNELWTLIAFQLAKEYGCTTPESFDRISPIPICATEQMMSRFDWIWNWPNFDEHLLYDFPMSILPVFHWNAFVPENTGSIHNLSAVPQTMIIHWQPFLPAFVRLPFHSQCVFCSFKLIKIPNRMHGQSSTLVKIETAFIDSTGYRLRSR